MSASDAPPPAPPAEPPSEAEERRRVAAGAGLVSAAKLTGSILNMLVLVFLTRLLDKADLAIILWVYLIQETLNALGPLGLPDALAFFVPKLGDKHARSLGVHTALTLVVLAIPWAIVLWLGGPAFAEWKAMPELGPALGLLGLAVLVDFPGATLPGYLLAREQYAANAAVTLVFYVSRFISLIVPAWLGEPPLVIVSWFLAVAVLRVLLFVLWFVFVARGPIRGEGRAGWRIRDLFAYGVPLSLSAIVGKLNVQIDKYLIGVIAVAEVFAIYNVGALEVPLVAGVAYSVTAALVPTLVMRYADGRHDEFVALWHGSMAKVATVIMPAFAALFLLAEPVVRLIFSEAYEAASVPFRVYLCLLPLRLCSYGAILRALGTTRPVLIAVGAGLVANVALNYPMYALFGLAGPALASVVAQCVIIGLMLSVARRRLNRSWSEIFPYGPWLRTLVVAAVAAIPLWLVLGLVEGDVLAIAVGVPVYLVTYLVLARTTGLIGADDVRYVLDFVTGRAFRTARRR